MCDPSLKRAIRERIKVDYTHEKALYKCSVKISVLTADRSTACDFAKHQGPYLQKILRQT